MPNMPGMALQHAAGGGPVNLLPGPLCAAMVVVYLAIFVNHLRHAFDTGRQRRLWHVGHVLMALGMAYMFIPSSAGAPVIAGGVWQAIYGCALLIVVLGMTAYTAGRRAPSGLWLLLAVDLAAMLYMWSPGDLTVPISWALVAFLVFEAGLWASRRVLGVDRSWLPNGSYDAGGNLGVLRIAAVAPLARERDLRVTMPAMTLGMAYMVLAMQIMH